MRSPASTAYPSILKPDGGMSAVLAALKLLREGAGASGEPGAPAPRRPLRRSPSASSLDSVASSLSGGGDVGGDCTASDEPSLLKAWEGWQISQLAQHDGLALLLDCALHVLLLARLGAASLLSQRQLAALCASLCIAAAQLALFARCHATYMRHRLPIIAVRRLTAAALIAQLTVPLVAAAARWPMLRLLLAGSATVINLNYLLWFRTTMCWCAPINAAAMALFLPVGPQACAAAAAAAGGPAGLAPHVLALARALHSAAQLPNLLVPGPLGSSCWLPNEAAARASSADSSAGPSPSAGAARGVCSPGGGLVAPSEAELLPLCASAVTTVQLTLGVVAPAFVLFVLEQRSRAAFVRRRHAAAARDHTRPVPGLRLAAWWADGPLMLAPLFVVWLMLGMNVAWLSLTSWHGLQL